ncbi:MAG: hypothetical protein LBK43_01380 [Treponema sp.]|nr:hypothetical protein [Treponema sp.]
MIEIHGKIGGNTYKLGFRRTGDGADDYIVSGDDVAIEKFLSEAKKDHGVLGLPPADWSFKEGYLNSEYPAAALAEVAVFDTITKSIDDWEDIPEGAVY